MYEIKVITGFSSAHALRGYNGKCENIHGHNWQVEATVFSESVNEIGISIDFKELKQYVNKIMEYFDHKFINELPYFEKLNPSAENIAKYIYEELERALRSKWEGTVGIRKVNVYETPSSMASYYR